MKVTRGPTRRIRLICLINVRCAAARLHGKGLKTAAARPSRELRIRARIIDLSEGNARTGRADSRYGPRARNDYGYPLCALFRYARRPLHADYGSKTSFSRESLPGGVHRLNWMNCVPMIYFKNKNLQQITKHRILFYKQRVLFLRSWSFEKTAWKKYTKNIFIEWRACSTAC